MTETLRKSLSALADQEATEFETRKILDALKSRGDLKKYWASCQVISSSMRGEPALGINLLNRINGELDETNAVKPVADQKNTAMDPCVTFLPINIKESFPNKVGVLIGQFAVAASVAFAVVIGVKVIVPGEMTVPITATGAPEIIKFQLPVQKQTVSVDGIISEQDAADRRPVMRFLTERDQIQRVSNRLGPYLIRHAENTAVVGSTSVLPLARIMGRDEPIE